MKTILCYGDSLTWGFDAEKGGRHRLEDRWPSVLAQALGERVTVIPEGLSGRTTAYDDHLAPTERNGAKVLPTILGTHEPLDLVVILLGTNDLKINAGGGRAFEARIGMERLVQIVRSFPYQDDHGVPEVLIVSPPVFVETPNDVYDQLFGHALAQSRLIAPAYVALAAEAGCHVFDATTVAEATALDGVHLDAANTRAIGQALVEPVRTILSGR
ncbi:MAG: SGNH/GDSL hydrolase family protein [Rhizobiaceae bacterium]|nr:SGNH/GDSL hydrolase family protein [Rhizobiaceae bacterium]